MATHHHIDLGYSLGQPQIFAAQGPVGGPLDATVGEADHHVHPLDVL
ncbi:MAG TPA: hypothetical protein VKJ47_21495 [Candidatus Binatia bacterium]|nr:hypothetical protein [Candidatus Binatia bacterium]